MSENKLKSEFPRIGAPAFRALDSLGITKLEQVASYTEKQLLSLHGFGPKALKLLRAALSERGMAFVKE